MTKEKSIVYLRIRKTGNGDEWAVQWIQDGVYDEGKTYYTDAKDDAIDTKKAIIEEESKKEYCKNVTFK